MYLCRSGVVDFSLVSDLVDFSVVCRATTAQLRQDVVNYSAAGISGYTSWLVDMVGLIIINISHIIVCV